MPDDDPAARRRGLTRRFGGLAAVDASRSTLARGEVHAVIGTNGAGKSTLVNMLSGELAADRRHASSARAATSRAGRSRGARAPASAAATSARPSFRAQRARELPPGRAGASPASARWWSAAARCARQHAARASRRSSRPAWPAQAHRIAGTLTHGRSASSRSPCASPPAPQVLLLDEPLAGMGAEETERMLALLAALKPGHAILLVEHDMDAVFRIADRITVMVNGAVIATATPAAIRGNAAVQIGYLGEADEAQTGIIASRRAWRPERLAASPVHGDCDERAPRSARPARPLRRQPRAARRLARDPRRRVGRPARPQRHGQDHADPHADRATCATAPAACSCTAATARRAARSDGAARHRATCPKAAASSPTSRCARTW